MVAPNRVLGNIQFSPSTFIPTTSQIKHLPAGLVIDINITKKVNNFDSVRRRSLSSSNISSRSILVKSMKEQSYRMTSLIKNSENSSAALSCCMITIVKKLVMLIWQLILLFSKDYSMFQTRHWPSISLASLILMMSSSSTSNYRTILSNLQSQNYGTVISTLFLFMDYWNTLPLISTTLRSFWPVWSNILKTKRLKRPSLMTSRTSKILVKLLGSLFPPSIILNRIFLLLTIIKIVLGKKKHINSPPKSTQKKTVRKGEKH